MFLNLNCCHQKVLLKVFVKVWHILLEFIYWYWYRQYFFHEVYVLVLTILLKSIVNNPGYSIENLLTTNIKTDDDEQRNGAEHDRTHFRCQTLTSVLVGLGLVLIPRVDCRSV